MPPHVLTDVFATTSAAHTLAIRGVDVRVRSIELVASIASDLFAILSGRHSIPAFADHVPGVVRWSPLKHMLRVEARAVVAVVARIVSGPNRSTELPFKYDPVDADALATSRRHAVAHTRSTKGPIDAGRHAFGMKRNA